MYKVRCDTCPVRSRSCIADLPKDRLDRFEACSVVGLYKPGQVLFREGTPTRGIYLVCHGSIKVYRTDRSGRDLILDVARPASVLGDFGPNGDETFTTSAEALTEAQVCLIPRENILRVVREHPESGVRMLALLGEALADVRKKAAQLAFLPAEARMADLLLRLADDEGRVADRFTRRDLGEMIGVSQETAIRLIGKLKELHMIENGHGLAILDRAGLDRLAAAGD